MADNGFMLIFLKKLLELESTQTGAFSPIWVMSVVSQPGLGVSGSLLSLSAG